MSWSTSELRVRLAPLNRFKPSSKILYWPFQGGISFEDIFMFLFCLVFATSLCVCLYVLCGHLLGKGWPLGSRLWCLTVSLSLSHWYPGSGVVLDCIDFWSLHPYLLRVHFQTQNNAQWSAACGHVSASTQSLRFILSLRLYSSYILPKDTLLRHIWLHNSWWLGLCGGGRTSPCPSL